MDHPKNEQMKKNWTGERLETFIMNETTMEHLHRYALAQCFVEDKTVLDVACGEGYGASLLGQKARKVNAIDIDAQTVQVAKDKYQQDNIQFLQGDILSLSLTDSIFDVVVCFETLEHVMDHDRMIRELKRVLKPGGLILISTPDKKNYSEKNGYQNPFHVKELYEHEFKDLIGRNFQNTAYLKQNYLQGSILISNKDDNNMQFFEGDFNILQKVNSPEAKYHIAIASDESLPFIPSSIFYNQKLFSQELFELQERLKKTITYRTGAFILAPFKLIRSLFNR
jgi:ubiquinone/menaquinone biosynthesis C-methylase UbiE